MLKSKLSFAYAMALLVGLLLLFSNISLPQSAWSNQGSWSYPDKNTSVFSFYGTLNGDDTLYTKAFSNKDKLRKYTLWYYAYQGNDSVRVNFVTQALAIISQTSLSTTASTDTSKWKTIETVGIDSVASTVGYWSDSLAIEAISWRYAILGSSITGGDKQGFNGVFYGKAVFKEE